MTEHTDLDETIDVPDHVTVTKDGGRYHNNPEKIILLARQGGKTAELLAVAEAAKAEIREAFAVKEREAVMLGYDEAVDPPLLTAPKRQTWQDQRQHLESRGRRYGP